MSSYQHSLPLKDLRYVWDDAEKLCYVAEAIYVRHSPVFTVLGCVLEEGPPHPSLPHGLGTQQDLERACARLPWWQPWWSFPPLSEDPVPF